MLSPMNKVEAACALQPFGACEVIMLVGLPGELLQMCFAWYPAHLWETFNSAIIACLQLCVWFWRAQVALWSACC